MSKTSSGSIPIHQYEADDSAVVLVAAALVAAMMLPVLLHLYCDFKAFLALGPGGTPHTLAGYMQVKALSLFAIKDVYEAPAIPKELTGPGYLLRLPARGQRPVTRGIAPHRQVTQRAGMAVYRKLAEGIESLGSTNDRLVLGTSCFEKHGTGLFSTSPARRTCKGEICHSHPSDGSMHMTLHPLDAKLALEAGWAERHPLARGGWFERFVPAGFVMVYAPRGEEDVETALEIVKAAAWYISAGKCVMGLMDGKRRDSGYGLNDGAPRAPHDHAALVLAT